MPAQRFTVTPAGPDVWVLDGARVHAVAEAELGHDSSTGEWIVNIMFREAEINGVPLRRSWGRYVPAYEGRPAYAHASPYRADDYIPASDSAREILGEAAACIGPQVLTPRRVAMAEVREADAAVVEARESVVAARRRVLSSEQAVKDAVAKRDALLAKLDEHIDQAADAAAK